MSGFASGLLAGSQTASRWVDAYNQGEDRRDRAAQLAEQKAIMGAQPEQVQGFSAGQGELLRQAAAAGNTIGWDEQIGSYTIKAPGSESTTPVSPQAMTHFLGGAQEGVMTPAQANQMRYGALARSAMARDPVKGAALAAALGKMGDDELAKEKAEALKVKESAFYSDLANMKFEDMVNLAGGAINPDPEVGAMISYDPKAKEAYLASSIEGIPAQKVSRAELMNMLGASFREGQGDLNKGVKGMLAQMQTMRAEQSKTRKAEADVMYRGAQVGNISNQMENRDTRTAIQQQKADQDGDYRTGQLQIGAMNAGTSQARGKAYVGNQEAQARKADRAGSAAVAKPEYTPTEQTQRKVWESEAKAGDDRAMEKIAALDKTATERANTTALARYIKEKNLTSEEVRDRVKKQGGSPAYAEALLKRVSELNRAMNIGKGGR